MFKRAFYEGSFFLFYKQNLQIITGEKEKAHICIYLYVSQIFIFF